MKSMKLIGILSVAAVLPLATVAANLAAYKGEVGVKSGWKCVGSEAGKIVYIPFEGYYESKGGRIESPRFKLGATVGENSFYRLTFSAKCPVDGYWWVDFFDAKGNLLPDVNSRLYASDDWKAYDVIVPAHPDAVQGQIAFVTKKGAKAKDVAIARVTAAEAVKWCDEFAATLPKLDAPKTAGAWAKLPKTKEKILSGKPVNIVFLGDSIVNDTWCGNAVAQIQQALPGADLRCFISVRGGTGCWYYHEKANFDEYVTRYRPDLVLIGGISNVGGKNRDFKFLEDCFAETIERCQKIGAEVVVMTPPPSYEFRKDATAKPFDPALTREGTKYSCLEQDYERRAAARTGVTVWDMTTAPADAISRSGRPLNWFKRDSAHNDDRGKQLIARTLKAYFAALGDCVGAADLEKDLWLLADFDGPAELKGAAVGSLPKGDGKTTPGYAEGRFGRGYAFLTPTNGATKASIHLNDPKLLEDFPIASGAMAYWTKTPAGIDLKKPSPTFIGPAGFDGRIFKRWKDSGGWLYLNKDEGLRSHEWKHVCFTWDKGTIRYFENGQLRHEIKERKFSDTVKGQETINVAIGCGDHKWIPADAIIDECALFSRSLAPLEVAALARAKAPLRAPGRLTASPVQNTVFFRNEPNAALRLTVYATKPGAYAFSGTVGGKAIKGGTVTLKAGANDVDVPFEAVRYRAGEYAWEFELKGALKRSGMLTIRPRFERDRYTVLSWGPHADVAWMKDLGINAANAHPWEYALRDAMFENDFAFSMRSINWKTYLPLDFSEEKLRANCRAELEPMRGVHSWTMTLQNTEYYAFGHLPYEQLLKSTWRPFAEKSFGKPLPDPNKIGKEPMHYRWHRPGMSWITDPPKGVQSINEIDFCSWFYKEGNPLYMGNKITQKEIRTLSPGNVCWAEPIIEEWNIGAHHDLTADWLYMYYTTDNLEALWSQYGQLRGIDKPYMPTPSFFPYHTVGYGVNHPTLKRKNGKPQVMCPLATSDEMAVYSYLSIGAVPAHALSFFAPVDWYRGAKNGAVYATNRLAIAGWFCDPKDPERFGRHFREKILPMAEFLQDMPNAPAPFAFAYPAENRYIDGWLSQTHVGRYKRLAGWYGVPYDVLGEFELTPEKMGRYRYVVMPAARIFTPEHDAAIRATKAPTEFIFDGRCPTNLYPKSVHLTGMPAWQKDWRFDRTAESKVNAPFLDWFTNRLDELRAMLPARSDQDGEFSARTFLKEYNGAKYVMVLNDKRYRDENAIQESILTNGWYRPHVAPQTITTHLPVYPGGATYVFREPAQKKLFGLMDAVKNEPTVTRDYGIAEAKLFCLYPKKLAAPAVEMKKVKVKGEGEDKKVGGESGWTVELSVALNDVEGKAAAGRGMVELTLVDGEGKLREESGRYVVEKGRKTIPLYLADDDRADFAKGGWRATVKDLVTGLEVQCDL